MSAGLPTLQRLILPAPAKLNLFLHIIGRRDDGYHELQTVFQLLDYGDTLEFALRDDGQIQLEQPLPGVDDADNIVLRAAKLLREQTGAGPKVGVSIDMIKRLPMGGGLGGGSSDAATTLLGLNRLWQLGLSLDQLAELGLTLGADVPVFVRGRSSFAEGVGERLEPLELPKSWFAVIKPPVSVSTGVIFSHPQLTRDSLAIRIPAVFEAAQDGVDPLDGTDPLLNPDLRNDCEAVVRSEYPAIDQALQWLNQQRNIIGTARLTGTGACIFARFETATAAQATINRLPEGFTGFIAQGSSKSTAHVALAQQLALAKK